MWLGWGLGYKYKGFKVGRKLLNQITFKVLVLLKLISIRKF